jgi:hypothetical protein
MLFCGGCAPVKGLGKVQFVQVQTALIHRSLEAFCTLELCNMLSSHRIRICQHLGGFCLGLVDEIHFANPKVYSTGRKENWSVPKNKKDKPFNKVIFPRKAVTFAKAPTTRNFCMKK